MEISNVRPSQFPNFEIILIEMSVEAQAPNYRLQLQVTIRSIPHVCACTHKRNNFQTNTCVNLQVRIKKSPLNFQKPLIKITKPRKELQFDTGIFKQISLHKYGR